MSLQLGLNTFGDVAIDDAGWPAPHARVLRDVLEEAVLADDLGVDAFDVGGTPESVVRAARYGLPLTLAIIGGHPRRFRAYVGLYLESLERFGHPPRPVAVHSPGHVAETDEQAQAELWPHYQTMINRIGAERGWAPIDRAHFDREAGPDGALCVGSPETVAGKIARTVTQLGLSRFDLKYSHGTLPHDRLMASIELFGTQVARRVRELAGKPA